MNSNYPPNINEALKSHGADRPNPALAKFHELLHKELVHQAKVPCCLTCVHFLGSDYGETTNPAEVDFCNKFNARPPASTIVFGCNHWDIDDIPF